MPVNGGKLSRCSYLRGYDKNGHFSRIEKTTVYQVILRSNDMEISTIAMMGAAGVCLLAGKTLAWKKGIPAKPVNSTTLHGEAREQGTDPLALSASTLPEHQDEKTVTT
jgi:hypothetical protein